MANIKITRKCASCKELIDLDKDNFVYIKNMYYHFDHAVEDKLNMKRNKLSKEQIIEQLIEIQKENQKEINTRKEKDRLYKWLQYTYNTVVLPKNFYTKMNDIFCGTYKGLSKGIPVEDLLDMWKRKFNELEKVNDQNKRKGKVLIGVGRINYDLAILLGKYDSYLKWKEEQKLLEIEKENAILEANKPKINYELINKSIENNQKEDTNIDDILNEVF